MRGHKKCQNFWDCLELQLVLKGIKTVSCNWNWFSELGTEFDGVLVLSFSNLMSSIYDPFHDA